MPRQIAIVGSSPSSCDAAPFADPAWEIWALAWRDVPRADRLFEIHDPAFWPRYADAGYRERLAALPAGTLVIRTANPDLPNATVYPLQQVLGHVGMPGREAGFLTSSIAYMLALAIAEAAFIKGVETIALYGVDMSADDEWAYQRPAVEYLIGLAAGRGIKIVIPPESALCRAGFVYGVAGNGACAEAGPVPQATGITEAVLQARIDHYTRDQEETRARIRFEQARLQSLEGHITEDKALQELVRHFNRGGVIPGIAGPARSTGPGLSHKGD